MRLFHAPGSRATRVLWALEEIGAPYELTVLGADRRGEEHRERHPLGRVPVLELDDGTYVFESAAILLQLADMYPDSGLLPAAGTTERALAYQWTMFAMTELENRVFDWLFAKRRGEDETEHAARFAPLTAALERPLAHGPWLVGETFTVADILNATMLGNAYRNEMLTGDGVLREYVARAVARPAFARADAVDRQSMTPASDR
jgi:glutathione S-transferase